MKLFESGIFYIHQRKTGDTVDLLNGKKNVFENWENNLINVNV